MGRRGPRAPRRGSSRSVSRSTHECPAPGCTERVPTHRLACPTHWYAIPADLRGELWDAYRNYGPLSAKHCDAIEACITFLEQVAA